MSVSDVLARAGGEPSALALADMSRRWTFAELSDAVDERANRLRAGSPVDVLGAVPAGVGPSPSVVAPGDVVPVLLEPDADGVLTLLALWRVGAVPVPLNPRLTPAELLGVVSVLEGRTASDLPPATLAVLWTSGTGGTPRGVALSFEGLAASARASQERLALGSDDAWLVSLSLAHVGGLALVTRSLLLGSALVCTGRFDVADTMRAVVGKGRGELHGLPVSHVSLVPTQLRRLLDHARGRRPPPSFRCALIGGAHAPADVVARALRAGWPIALTYGATEMSSQIATAPPDLTRSKPGTVGSPLAKLELRLDDEEIMVRGPTCAIGYVSEAGVEEIADDDGWYRTGDLGRLDRDGHLWVTGRRADRIVSGGVTVDAVEVEEALRSHPAVLDACVAGVPDEEWGERVATWVEPVIGEFDQAEVEEYLRERLTGPKMPRLWHVSPGLPRNANGKADRAAVQTRLAQL